jgi:hypothetical protein
MRKIISIIIIGIILLSINACIPTTIDPYAKYYDFELVVKASDINKEKLTLNLLNNFKESKDYYIKAENYLIAGRILNEVSLKDVASDYFDKYLETTTGEEKALLYETQASLLGSKYFHARAAWKWKKLNNEFRYKLNKDLALGKEPNLTFQTIELPNNFIISNPNPKIIEIGNSNLTITEKDILVSQTDRVTRDWLSYQLQKPNSNILLSLFSEALSYPKEELMPEIGWHEGARIKEIKSITGLEHKIATGTIIVKKDGKWYAPNENDIFMFEVPIDKVSYPTLRPFNDHIAMMVDTHGINTIVKQAIDNNASIVIGCCDNPEKIKAAKYLSDRGIKVICNTDKYVPLLLGSNSNVFGSAPYERKGNTIIIGNRPLKINIDEPIVTSDVNSDVYALWYYETSTFYFKELEKRSGIDLNLHIINLTDFNQMEKVIEKAESINSNIIGVRVFNKDDYENVKNWLEKDLNHKAILFHSEAYPYGYKLAREFNIQTSFDDINPVIL